MPSHHDSATTPAAGCTNRMMPSSTEMTPHNTNSHSPAMRISDIPTAISATPVNDRPERDQIDDRDEGRAGRDEDRDPDQQIEDAFEQETAGAAVVPCRSERGDQREDAVDQGVGPENQDQRGGGARRPYKGD